VASPETPLLTAIALSADWSSGWLRLRSAGTWPSPPDVTDDICGKHGWAGRRRALTAIAASFVGNEDPNLWRGAKILAADPADPASCREITEMLVAELSQHNRTEAAADVIKGWDQLGQGFQIVGDEDPIKAAHNAAAYVHLKAAKTSPEPPSPEELAAGAILDNWEIIEVGGSRAVRGAISGSDKHADCELFMTEFVRDNDADMKWVRTSEEVYRLGYRRHEHPPIVRAALKSVWRAAYRLVYGITGVHMLRATVQDAAAAVGDSAIGRGEKMRAAKGVADALYADGRRMMAHAWYLLAADPCEPETCILAHSFLAADAGESLSPEVQAVVYGWSVLARTPGEDVDDPIHAARFIGDEHARPDDEEIEAPGVVVLKEVGGTQHTTTAKECIREFKDIVGVRLPLALAPDMARVRSTLHDEFPYAQQQIDLLLTGMIEGEPIRWRHILLVSKPGSGKSRLARRLAEEMHVGLHRYDASGSSDNAFGGTPRRWSSGEHCVPLEAVRRHKIGNVLCLIDEIDKSGNSRINGRIEHALMPFLEKETARAYPDPYAESDLNLSHVGYVLTCNSVDEIPAPLRDRLRIVRIPNPGREHMPALVRCIVADIAKESDPRWWPMLDDGECAIAETLWAGGSVRRLVAIVERILAYREQCPRN
jgi:ATPase family associated with various cellular activities (AAA)